MSGVLSSSLEDDVVLITGATGGIGRAITAALHAAGARIVGTDRVERPAGWEGETWLSHDVTEADDWKRVMDEIARRFGRLDALINNAGIALTEPIASTSLTQWRQVMSVNVESILMGMQASLPLLRESGANRAGGSSVVNISSVAGLVGAPLNAAYSASKGAVTLLTKSAAKEFAGLRYPIRVNSIHPGVVETPMMEAILKHYVEAGLAISTEQARCDIISRTPLHRLAQPQDIAGGVVYLCSPAASFITGTELIIDGGSLA